jgi:glycerol transport system ATP-binding protein
VKDSEIIFLDEPLANLDYKLREELRDELPKLFAGRNAIVFYATTEPHEALLFGGSTATLHEGRITQYGPTASIYREPNSRLSAQVFSDPPINLVRVGKSGSKLTMPDGVSWTLPARAKKMSDGNYDLGLRPHHLQPASAKSANGMTGRVMVTEISGSESVFHVEALGQTWVSQASGVHPLKVGEKAHFAADLSHAVFFSTSGERVL